MRGARTLDYFHPVLGRAGVAPEVAPSAEVRVEGRGRWGEEREWWVGTSAATRGSVVQSELVLSLSPLPILP